MKLEELVNHLTRKGWAAQSRQRPYEESIEGWDPLPVDWDQLPRGEGFQREDFAPNRDRDRWQGRWEEVADQIHRARQRAGTTPAPTNVDALAWYLPFHRYGADSGIYIKESAVIDLAGRIKAHLLSGLDPILEAKQLIHQALAILFFHEMFHHRIECFATRLEIARDAAVYVPYETNVFYPSIGTDELLEEAFACASMIARLNEGRYRKAVHDGVRDATRRFLFNWIPTLEPGYRLGVYIKPDRDEVLLAQIADCSIHPKNPDDWRHALDMTRGFFKVSTITKVVIPKGATPTIPWLDTTL